jgi:hypothetical protein
MKWFSFLVVAFAAVSLFFPSVAFSDSENPVIINSIFHFNDSAAKETITFKFAASVVPKIFTLRGENPRLVIDFPQSIYLGKNFIELTDGTLASAIRIGLHQTPAKKTRVVVDLSKETPVQYASEYSEEDNTLVVTLTPDTDEQRLSPVPNLQSENQSTQLSQVVQLASPLEEKTVSPVLSTGIVENKAAGKSLVTPVVSTILDISFDDSSSKGEMVLFHLNDFYPPTVSASEKNAPQVLCDFSATNLGPDVQENILAKGKYIERIRTAKHHDPEKVRVVLDLSPDRDYDLQQVFFKNDNLFVLIVNELSPIQDVQ